MILTNPPFGGEEEAGIQANFPPNMQTAETALLFLQFIMRKLRVAGRRCPAASRARGGRAAVVVPNGTLFGDGVCAVIKEELLKEFHLHTIVRLPQGVFAPYTDIPTNLLFFERGGPTDTIWYYELPLPEGRKKYSKTAPLQFEEFAAALAWWNDRQKARRPGRWTLRPSELPPLKLRRRTGRGPRPNAMRRWRWASRCASWSRPSAPRPTARRRRCRSGCAR